MKNSNGISESSRDDMAFLNSILSYGIYTGREWMLGLGDVGNAEPKSFDDAVTEAALQSFRSEKKPEDLARRYYEMYISDYFRSKCSKVSLQEDQTVEFSSINYGYKTECEFSQGSYVSLDNLARAGYFLSDNGDGTKNLHLVFRGTDPKAKGVIEFFSKAYLDISAYYDSFKPLEYKILDYAKDPANKIKSVHVSGHSLGGALVQEFFNSTSVKDSGLDLVGFTYGAPGTSKRPIHTALANAFHAINKAAQKSKFSAFVQMGVEILNFNLISILPSPLSITNLLSTSVLGVNLASLSAETSPSPSPTIDSRIFQFEHAGDLIPKIGAIYQETGQEIYLKDVASKNAEETFMLTGRELSKSKHKFFSIMTDSFNLLVKKPVNFLRGVCKFEFHDMLRYTINLDHKISATASLKNDSDTSEDTPYHSSFIGYKTRHTTVTSRQYSTIDELSHMRVSRDLHGNMATYQNVSLSNSVLTDILGKETNHGLQSVHFINMDFKADKAFNKLTIESLTSLRYTSQLSGNVDKESIETKLKINTVKELRKKFLDSSSDWNYKP